MLTCILLTGSFKHLHVIERDSNLSSAYFIYVFFAGVLGVVIINADGIPIRTTMDNAASVQARTRYRNARMQRIVMLKRAPRPALLFTFNLCLTLTAQKKKCRVCAVA